eukprot:4517709-Amphidinium_carterae.1
MAADTASHTPTSLCRLKRRQGHGESMWCWQCAAPTHSTAVDTRSSGAEEGSDLQSRSHSPYCQAKENKLGTEGTFGSSLQHSRWIRFCFREMNSCPAVFAVPLSLSHPFLPFAASIAWFCHRWKNRLCVILSLFRFRSRLTGQNKDDQKENENTCMF